MSHADKRTPVTDALETLGMIHFKPEKRDAIHLAVEPVKCGELPLRAGERIGIINGVAYPVGYLAEERELCHITVLLTHSYQPM